MNQALNFQAEHIREDEILHCNAATVNKKHNHKHNYHCHHHNSYDPHNRLHNHKAGRDAHQNADATERLSN